MTKHEQTQCIDCGKQKDYCTCKRCPNGAKAIPEAHEDDGVRKPSHYQVFDGVESIEIIARSMTVSEFRGFCMGNVLKYRLRAGKKSELATMEKDLNKAAFYQELFDLHKGKCYDSE
ncbi:Putative phage protein [Cronobacter phage Dev2]|uniref:Putative phage protein n=1 Tax=Cronobacter phage Dev2 TaxID=1410331 RepID=W6PDA7_9CAUD|nr:nucleotide kinase [Cronobacter phage Dev2]CDM12536.1 Putative phage protein [Cronobacter phage Dev2]